MSSLTAQQAQAVTHRGSSVVLSSGAGCGKTHVLTERYLSLLTRDGLDVSQIVAITFTDKAAREMRKRIRAALERELETANNKERWRTQLRGLETAPISTIHSFCQHLLRGHAAEVGLDPEFTVLEEAFAPDLRSTSVRAALFELLTANSPAADALRELITWYGWWATEQAINDLVGQFDADRWAEWLAMPPSSWAKDWRNFHAGELAEMYSSHRLRPGTPIATALATIRTLSGLNGKAAERAGILLSETPKLPKSNHRIGLLELLAETGKVQGTKAEHWGGTNQHANAKSCLTGFRDELKDLSSFLSVPEDIEAAAQFGQSWLRVADVCANAYGEAKRHGGHVDFQDLLVLARDLLRDHRTVRAGVQQRYRSILVDELQDTDPVQMELIEHLCGSGLASGKLFAVGDAKQSIYRFRGAEVALFESLRRQMPEPGRQSLTVNFRSQPAILNFTNTLLRDHMSGYEDLVAHWPQVNPGPCVEFLWSPEQVNVAASRQREAAQIARRIKAMVEQQEMLVTNRTGRHLELRPVLAEDVVLLFRAMTNVPIYEAALRDADLDYYLVGGRAFFAQQEIYDLLNLLSAIENPRDNLALVAALRSPFGAVSDDGIYRLARHERGTWGGLRDPDLDLPVADRPSVTRFASAFGAWRELKNRLPIVGLIQRILDDTGYDAALRFEPLGDRKLANLWKLIDLARTFDREAGRTLADFVTRLRDLVNDPPREEQAATQPEKAEGVVRLMSIHQAKGLEFPVVFLPDLAAKRGGGFPPLAVWDQKLGCVAKPPGDQEPAPFTDWPRRLWSAQEDIAEWHEDLRTLYVACTRAKDYLVLSGSLPDPFRPTNTAMTVLAQRFDLVAGTTSTGAPFPIRLNGNRT